MITLETITNHKEILALENHKIVLTPSEGLTVASDFFCSFQTTADLLIRGPKTFTSTKYKIDLYECHLPGFPDRFFFTTLKLNS